MKDVSDTFAMVGAAIIGVATIAVVFSRQSNTVNVVGVFGAGFSRFLNAALSPITGNLSPVNGISGISASQSDGFGSGGNGTGAGMGSVLAPGSVAIPQADAQGVGLGNTSNGADVTVGGAHVVADPNTETFNGKTYHWNGSQWLEQ